MLCAAAASGLGAMGAANDPAAKERTASLVKSMIAMDNECGCRRLKSVGGGLKRG